MDRGAVAGSRLVDDGGAEPSGHLGGAVGGAVVDDDRPEAGGHGGEHERERGRFVPARDDDVAVDPCRSMVSTLWDPRRGHHLNG